MDELILAINNLSNKTWFDYFVAIAPLVLSIVAIYISIDSTRKQNKIALLDKRLAIYTDLKICISNVISEGKVTTQNANMFIFKARDVKFLFDNQLKELCDEIYISMHELRHAGMKDEVGITVSDNAGNNAENCDHEEVLLQKMFEYSKKLEDAFSPYISFKKEKTLKRKRKVSKKR